MNNNAYNVELKTSQLRQKLNTLVSSKSALLILYEYYDFLLGSNIKQLIEAYIPEFIQRYVSLLNNFDPYCLNPSVTKALIKQINELDNYLSESEIKTSLKNSAQRLRKELEQFKAVLEGQTPNELITDKLCFPLIEENDGESLSVSTGILETLTIKVSKTKDENKFLLIPSEIKIETQLINQIETSWQKAFEIVKRYARRIAPHHEVIIRFDKRVGFYRGNSLGAALTLAFIEELLNYYNSPVVIRTGKGIALTGGLNEDGSLIETSKEVIEKKVEIVFFSPIQTFVVPEDDLPYAVSKLKTLQKEFPGRKLNLIGIQTFDDLLDSRKLVDIRKQKIVVRSAKFARKNWAAAILLAALILLVYVGRFYDFDKNPAILKNERDWLYVQNKNGKELWKKKMGFDVSQDIQQQVANVTEKIIDIDSDGINEVILARENRLNKKLNGPVGRITCFSKTGEIIWENFFHDRVESIEMIHTDEYMSMIIDTVTINETKTISCFANNVLYPSAVYFLELKTGKRIGPTLWNTGHLHSGKIGDFNNDGTREIVMFGLNNAYKRVIVFSIDIDKIGGKLPSAGLRQFVGLENANVNQYVLLPNTDYTLKLTGKYNVTLPGKIRISKEEKRINNYLAEGKEPDYKGIFIELDGNLNITKIDPSLEFEIARDSLVSAGELSLPFTHTEEYQQILYNQIEYWDGEKFTRRLKDVLMK